MKLCSVYNVTLKSYLPKAKKYINKHEIDRGPY